MERRARHGYRHEQAQRLRSAEWRTAFCQCRVEREWIENGAQLAWLIDPERRVIEVYRPDRERETVENVTNVTGEGPVEGFVLDLLPVWDPIQQR